MRRYTLAELEEMSTIHYGHFDNLKIETFDPHTRVWQSRMTVEDGMPYNNQVTVEQYHRKKGWLTVDQYEAH